MLLCLGFIACTAVIVYSGTRLSKYGDIIAEKTGLGKAWIGVVLMASVTSLPELVTGITSVTYANVPDIAVGDIFGSYMFNMIISAISAIAMTVIAIIGLTYRAEKKPLYFMAWDSMGITAVYIINLMLLYRLR